ARAAGSGGAALRVRGRGAVPRAHRAGADRRGPGRAKKWATGRASEWTIRWTIRKKRAAGADRVPRAAAGGRAGAVRRVLCGRPRARGRGDPRGQPWGRRGRRERSIRRAGGGGGQPMRGMRSLELGRVLLGLGACVFGAGALGACTTGEGTGEVRSEHLFLRDCHNGPFDLQPDFFATNPFKATQTIRVQRGDRMEELSDGLSILVTDVAAIRGDDGGEGRLGQDVRIGLPVGVAPPGQVVEYDPDPPPVSMTLYLNDSCHVQNSAIYAID